MSCPTHDSEWNILKRFSSIWVWAIYSSILSYIHTLCDLDVLWMYCDMRFYLSCPSTYTQNHQSFDFFLCCVIHFSTKSSVWSAAHNGCCGSGAMLLLIKLPSFWPDRSVITGCRTTPTHYHSRADSTTGRHKLLHHNSLPSFTWRRGGVSLGQSGLLCRLGINHLDHSLTFLSLLPYPSLEDNWMRNVTDGSWTLLHYKFSVGPMAKETRWH